MDLEELLVEPPLETIVPRRGSNGASTKPLRQNADHRVLVGRSPLLPLDVAHGMFAAADRAAYLRRLIADDPRICLALHVASPSLLRALRRDIERGLSSSRAITTACAYVVRMATRPTPFGLFASVGSIAIGDASRAAHLGTRGRTRSRIDVGFLQRRIVEIENDDSLRHRMSFTLNDLTMERNGRLIVLNPNAITRMDDSDWNCEYTRTSLRIAPAVRFVMDSLADAWRTFGELRQSLCVTYALSEERASRLLDQLWKVGLILSELRASPTNDIEGRLVQFATEHEDGRLLTTLGRATSVLRGIDMLPMTKRSPRHYAVVEDALARRDATSGSTIQVDYQREFEGSIPDAVIDEMFRFGHLMYRLSPRCTMNAAHEHFLRKYEGTSRLVPVLEFTSGDAWSDDVFRLRAVRNDEWNMRREETLLQKILEATRDRSLECAVSDADIASLSFPGDVEAEICDSQEMLLEVHAKSAADVQEGRYMLSAPSYIGVGSYAPSFGRFGDLLGTDLLDRVREGSSRQRASDDAIQVELSYWPVDERALNVVSRRPVRELELSVGLPNVPANVRKVTIGDVYVGIEDERFFLWSARHGRRIDLAQGHVYRSINTPPLVRFLQQVRNDGRRMFRPLDSGTVGNAPFFPRLVHGRFALSKARWTIPKSALADRSNLVREIARLRESWNLPAKVSLIEEDRKLFLDLGSDLGIEMLFEHAKKMRGRVDLEEFLPSTYGAWMQGEGGPHTVELLASQVRDRATSTQRRMPAIVVGEAARIAAYDDWLYYSIYCASSDADHLLADSIVPVIEQLEAMGSIEKWFFLRYRDPDFHVRVRAKATTPAARRELEDAISGVLSSLAVARGIDRFTIGTYHRELERYGGEGCIGHVESLFHADSVEVVTHLRNRLASRAQRSQAALSSIDVLVRSLLVDDAELAAWLRARRAPLRKLPAPLWEDIRAVRQGFVDSDLGSERFASNRRLWEAVRTAGFPEQGPSLWSVLESIMHMHWNRFGIHGSAESDLRSSLWHLYHGLSSRGRDNAIARS